MTSPSNHLTPSPIAEDLSHFGGEALPVYTLEG